MLQLPRIWGAFRTEVHYSKGTQWVRIAKETSGGSNSVVESQPSKLLVAGSIPVSRSMISFEDPGPG